MTQETSEIETLPAPDTELEGHTSEVKVGPAMNMFHDLSWRVSRCGWSAAVFLGPEMGVSMVMGVPQKKWMVYDGL